MTAAPCVGYANSPRDFAVGSVKVTNDSLGCLQHISFSAYSGLSSEDLQGQVHVTADCSILA